MSIWSVSKCVQLHTDPQCHFWAELYPCFQLSKLPRFCIQVLNCCIKATKIGVSKFSNVVSKLPRLLYQLMFYLFHQIPPYVSAGKKKSFCCEQSPLVWLIVLSILSFWCFLEYGIDSKEEVKISKMWIKLNF